MAEVREDGGRRRRARSRCSGRTSTPTAATCPRPGAAAASFAELLQAARRDRRHRADPLHEPAPEGHARGRDPRARRAAERLRAHPPAAAVGLQPHPQGDAAHLRPRALPRPRGDDPRARPRRGAQHRHHRRLPGRDRGGLRARRSRWSRRSATTAPSRSSSRRAAAPRRPRSARESLPHPVKVERMERARRAGPAPGARARPAVRRAHARGARRRALAHRPRAPARPHPPQQGRQLHRPGGARAS